ncbi:MAG: V-type ATP synthase subunit A, partial [Brevinema sp.]
MKLIGTITRVNGPLVTIAVSDTVRLMEMVYVSHLKLIGEILSIEDNSAVIQVYETTDGVRLNDVVYGSGLPLSVELGPGLLSQMFDGIQRPLQAIADQSKSIFLKRGISVPPLDRTKKWNFTPSIAIGDELLLGAVIGTVPETELVLHKVMLAPNISGVVRSLVSAGEYTLDDVLGTLEDEHGMIHELKLSHRWPVKKARPYKKRFLPTEPLLTGQRIIDIFFPVAKGGAVAIPGGFGTGKTITQHQLAKWSDAKIVVYVGCGERGNEITEVLEE